MKQAWPHRYQLWLRVAFVVIFSGVSFLGLQFADLYALGSFAPEGHGPVGSWRATAPICWPRRSRMSPMCRSGRCWMCSAAS